MPRHTWSQRIGAIAERMATFARKKLPGGGIGQKASPVLTQLKSTLSSPAAQHRMHVGRHIIRCFG